MEIRNEKKNTDKIVSLIATHNNRLQCFIDLIYEYLSFKKDEGKIKFKNCAILRLEFDVYNLKLELVYDGEVKNSDKNLYYTTKDQKEQKDPKDPNEIIFERQTFNTQNKDVDHLSDFFKKMNINNIESDMNKTLKTRENEKKFMKVESIKRKELSVPGNKSVHITRVSAIIKFT